jgi:hypothetical protein
LAKLAAMWAFIHPTLYWLPSSLPFLHLGETFFSPDFPEWKLGRAKDALLSRWHHLLTWSNQIRSRTAQELIARIGQRQTLGVLDGTGTPIPLRLPFILETPQAKRELCLISKHEGLGISPLYPTAVDAIPALAGRFGGSRYPGARTIAERLVT